MLELRRLDGTLLASFAEVPEGTLVHREIMGEHYLKLPFVTAKPFYLRIGDYVNTDFGKFELTKPYKPRYNTRTSGYDYDLQLDAYYMKWKNKKVRYMPEYGAKEVTFKLTANIETHLNVVLRSINALGAKDSNFRYNGQPYVVQFLNFPEGKRATAKYYLYDKKDIISALDGLAKLYECEWWVEDNIIFFGKCEIGSSIVDISIESNADEMTRSEADTKYATRLYAFGSTRNLPHNFEDVGADVTIDGVVEKRLTLPTNLCPNGYLEDVDIQNEAEAIEGVIVNDDIYPKVLCEVSAVETYTDNVENEDGTITSQTFYRLKDSSGFQFSEDMILEGESLHILFQSGSMNGMDFECHYDNEGKYYEVIVNEDYGRLLPDATLHPVVGMKFVLYNWDATKIEATGIIDTAKKELYDYTLDYLNESKIDPSTYECTLKSVWVYNDGLHFRNFDMGTRVNLINDAFFEESRTSRIIGFEIKLDKPYDTPKYTVGEKAAYSRRKDMERQIEAVTVNGNAYVSSSGIGGGTSIYVIKRYDGAIPSDYNVFSAKRSMDEFLSRKMDDMATGLITFVKGLVSKARALFEGDVDIQGLLRGARAQFEGDIQVGGDLDVTGRERIDRIQSHNYSGSGLADTGYMITSDDGTGSSMAVLDYLTIRKKMIVNSIEVKETHFSAGDIAHTLASCEIARTDYLYVDENGGEELLGYSRIKVPWLLRGAALVLGVDNGIVRGLYSRYKRVRLTLTEEQLRRCNRIRCYFLSKDGDREIENWFRPNDLVRCQTWNVVRERRETFTPDFNDHAGNVYYWRKIHDVSWNTGETRYVARDSEGQPTDGTTTDISRAYINEGGVARLADNGIHSNSVDGAHAPKEIDGNTYHWFDVDYDYAAEQAGGTGSADKGSDIPAAGDKVVQFGNTTDPDRMNIYLIEVNGAGNPDAPDWKMYRGVYTFNLNQCWWGGESCMKTKWSVSTGIEAYAPSFKWITEYGRARQVITREEGFWSSIALERDDWSNYRQLSDYPDYSDDILDSSGNFVSRVNGKPKNWVRKCRYYDQLTHNGSVWLCSRAESFYWRDKDGNMVSSRVEGAEYVRDYTTQEPSEAAGDWTEQVGKGDPGAFKSQVFCRSNSTPSAPSNERKNGYNTYDNPVPPAVSGQPTWTDGAPGGTAILWMSTAWFHSDGTHSDWTTPRQQTDTETLDVEFSPNATQPSTPAGTAADKDTSSVKAQRHAQGWYDPNDTLPTQWTWSDMVWRAERRISNGVYYGNWTVSRIKGENSVRIDLTNENDTMLYSSSKGLVSGSVQSTAYLFDGSDDVSDSESTTWQVSASGCTLTSGNSRNIVVTGMTAMTAKVTVTATYTDRNKVVYTRSTQLTLKKIIDGDKYDLDITPSSIAYNVSKDSPATSDLTIRVWRTAVDGTHTLSAPPSGYYVYAGGTRLTASSTGTYSFTTDNSAISGLQVMIAKSADGTDTLDSETIPVVKAEDGSSPYFADIDNEMHSVACDKNGSTLDDFDLTVGVSLWHGSTPLDLTTLTTDTPEGFTITANKSAKTIRIQVAKGTAIAEVNDIRITVAGSGSGEHSLHFTLNGVRQGENGEPAVLYSLVPSVSSVVKKKDGTYSVNNVSCTRQKNVGGTITNNTTDGDITYKLDGGTEKAYTNNTDIAVTSFTKSIQFIFKVDGKTVDVETILMVADGMDGKTPTISIGTNGHWIINGTDTGVTAEGKDGTGVAIKGTVASTGKMTIENGRGYAVPMKDDGTDGTKTEAKHGDCYICDSNRHLYMFTTEPAVAWNDLGEFKGEPGKSSYMHIAWADKVTFSGGSYAAIEGFIKVYDGNPHDWVGFATDNSAEDPSDWKAYKWNYQRGADGSGTEYVYLLTKEGFKPTLNQTSGSGTPSEDEFLPSVGNYQSGKIYGDSRYFEDDPPASVSAEWSVLWWASRKYRDGAWQEFGDVTMHNRYSKDGENSIRLALDNEHEDFLYDGTTLVAPSAGASSPIRLYDGGNDITSSMPAPEIQSVSGTTKGTGGAYISNKTLYVKSITASTCEVVVKCTYNGADYFAKFTANKTNQDKYDIVCKPSSIAYNSTTHASKSSSATIQTVSLSATGIGIGGTSLSPSLSTSVGAGRLCVFWAPVNSNGIIGGFAPSPVTSKAVTKQECESYVGIYFELRYYTSSSAYRVCDYETVEIAKTKDGDSIQGEPGDNGVGLVVNPSSLILNEDSDASGQAYIREANNTATIRLYEGGAAQKITVTKQGATNYTWNGDELTGNGTPQVTMTLNVGNIASGDNVRTGSIALRATSEDGNVIDFSVPFYVNRLQTFSRVIDKGVEKALGEAHVYEMNPDGTVKDSEYLYKQVNSAKGAITTLQNTVGNASGGLVKQVSTLEQTAKGITSRVSRTEEKVALLSNKEELLDLTGLDPSKAYPVTINLRTGNENTSERIMCGVERPLNASYNAATSPDYYGHDTMGFMTILEWTTFQSGWGAVQVPTDWSTDDKKRYIDTFDKYWLSPSTAKVAGSIGQVIEVNKEFVYLRGGSKYRVYTSKSDAEIELHPSGVTITYRTGSRTLSVINASDIVEPVQDRRTKEQVSSEIRQTADSISLSVRSGIESSLRETGIDIVDKIITMKAEQTIFKDLSGREMISFEMVEYDGSYLPSLVFWDNKGKKGGNKSFVLNWKGLIDMTQHSASMIWGNEVMLGTLNGNRSFANGSKIYAEVLWFNKEERDGVKPSIYSVTKYMYYAGYTVVAGKKTWNPAEAGDYDGKTFDSDATSQLYLPTGTPTAGWYISEITEQETGTKVWRKIFSFTHYSGGMPDSVLSVCVDALEVYEIQGQVASIEYQFVDGLTDSSVTTGSDSLGNYMIVPTA